MRIGEWLKKDLKIKIISLLLALLFWLYVTNVTNPFKSVTIYNVPVTVINQDYLDQNNYKLRNSLRTYIDVTIRGRQDVVDKVKSTDFETTLDLSQITSVSDKKLKLTGPVCLVKNVTIESVNPQEIDIQLTRNRTGVFDVELVKSITMKPGYVLLKTTVERAQLFTDEAIIDSIGSIKAYLELTDLDRDMTKEVECKVFDKEGREIASVSKDLTVKVSVEVAKQVPVSLVTRGRLAANYVETQRVIEPDKVLVTGSAEVLEKLNDIKTEQVDIDDIDGDFSTTVPLVVPEGVKLVNSPSEINVKISVEKLVIKSFEFAKNQIAILNARNDGTLAYEIITDKVTLQFRGKQDDLDAISHDALRPAVDVSGLGEGTHRLMLNINMPGKGNLVQRAYVDVKVTKTPETPPAENTQAENTGTNP